MRFIIGGALAFRGVKRCSRCKVTTIDQATGEGGDIDLEPLATLRRFRAGKEKPGDVFVGMNVCHEWKHMAKLPSAQRIVRVGDPVAVLASGSIGPL